MIKIVKLLLLKWVHGLVNALPCKWEGGVGRDDPIVIQGSHFSFKHYVLPELTPFNVPTILDVTIY